MEIVRNIFSRLQFFLRQFCGSFFTGSSSQSKISENSLYIFKDRQTLLKCYNFFKYFQFSLLGLIFTFLWKFVERIIYVPFQDKEDNGFLLTNFRLSIFKVLWKINCCTPI